MGGVDSVRPVTMQSGSLAILLHAHLPFVRHPEHDEFHEEDWLFEAVVETYIPLLRIFRRMVSERVPFVVTLTLTPTLCAMLRDPLLQSRTERYLDRGVDISRREIERTAGDAHLNSLARFYHQRLTEAREFYLHVVNRDIVGAFCSVAGGRRGGDHHLRGHPRLSAADGRVCPRPLRAQVFIGRDYHRECFGKDPAGIWLPECGYIPGIDRVLQEANIRWFVVDAHGLMYGGTDRTVCHFLSVLHPCRARRFCP